MFRKRLRSTLVVCVAVIASLVMSTGQAAEGLTTMASAHPVSATVDRLEAALVDADFRIFARIDHGAGARSIAMELPAIELLIFGKPQAGTVLMQAEISAGIDLPMKFLVWEDDDGGVSIGWNDPAWVAARHGIDTDIPVVKNIAAALQRFASDAAQ